MAKFCETLSSLYSNLAKPILDTIIFNYQLTKSIGLVGMVGLTINYFVTARLLRAVTPSFGKLAAIEAKLEVCCQDVARFMSYVLTVFFFLG